MTRTLFLGSPEIALPSLRALSQAPGVELVGVVAQPDRPVGRKRRLQSCPIKGEAEALGLPVFTPEKVRDPAALEHLRGWSPELMIVCAYGQIFPEALLDMPSLGCFNLHFSLLPRWRGASPVQAALLAGDSVTGVSLQRMALELDAGAIAADTGPLAIAPEETAATLSDKLADAAAGLLLDTLPSLTRGETTLRPQPDAGITHCRTIRKHQGAVDFAAETALEIERKSRAYHPWPGCFVYLAGRRLVLTRVEIAAPPDVSAPATHPGKLHPSGEVDCREGRLRIESLKPEGKAEMDFASFLRGNPNAVGAMLRPKPT